MKKILTYVASLVLVAAIAVAGTLAYLTDRDSKVNTFTVGDVKIELNEEFEQGAELVPGVKVEKEATITNTGTNDAWVWMTVAVPAVLDDENTELGSANVLHWNMPGCFWNSYHNQEKYINTGIENGYLPAGSTGVADEDSWINDNVAVQETIDGIEYNVYTFKYVGAIVPGETTNIGLSEIYLDAKLDIDTDGQWYIVENGVATKVNWNSNTNGNPLVYVSAYAIQADGFKNVEAAYNAYNKQWGDNGSEYAPEYEVVNVSTMDELKAALSDAEEPVIVDAKGANLGDLDDVTFPDGTWIKNATFEGDASLGSYGNDVNGTVTFYNCTFTSKYAYAAHFDEGNGELVFINCNMSGWNSFGTAITGVTFNNCNFSHNGYYGLVRVYQDATFTNCTFAEDLEGVDTNATGTVVHFNDCKGISTEKIHNNETKKGVWYIDGVDVSNQITSW